MAPEALGAELELELELGFVADGELVCEEELISLLLPPPLRGGIMLGWGLEVACELAPDTELAMGLELVAAKVPVAVVDLTTVLKPDA